MARKLYALADRHGVISFAPAIPSGLLPIRRDYERRIRDLICATARHAYDGVTLLVPGVPEAANDDDALEALRCYRDRLAERQSRSAGGQA